MVTLKKDCFRKKLYRNIGQTVLLGKDDPGHGGDRLLHPPLPVPPGKVRCPHEFPFAESARDGFPPDRHKTEILAEPLQKTQGKTA